MNDILQLIGRDKELFDEDVRAHDELLVSIVQSKSFLVIGGAGSIGQAVVKEIFSRGPERLYVVDINENNLVELVRDIRSSLGYIRGDFKTYALDCGSVEYEAMLLSQKPFDYIFNLSALKHVRSEKDPFTLMRMVDVNILNAEGILNYAVQNKCDKYFCVSTDKAANPVNMMGASKRIMEMFLMRASLKIPVSTARFANVAFSDGSLLHGFNQRIMKQQPISAPRDIKRYFITPKESGQLCLLSCLLGENRDIFFPKLSDKLHLITFAEIAVQYLENLGLKPDLCESEDEARRKAREKNKGKWPCCFFDSDTTGEKDFEEFYTDRETIDWERFISLGVIKNEAVFDNEKLSGFIGRIEEMKQLKSWNKEEVLELFLEILPNFDHQEKDKNLDQKM
ncbi:UDP-N-acetylglucosamine 4,6-dehydratase [Desulfobacula sp.]|uniref:UDP-N-acetylglucosamine 4,6-dehydratase n=1 Tax=Desulfobacula sp. TaxID=2593537 RepID=UPI001ECD1986|nr:UDP-N-acetylglucosamine 4,6-dehydratase [Desulfobacula sp.]